ncbi:MAG: cell wall hydrolase [Lachnospiraceae bacterium]|nr:cell wall hydrolase [Lachnospiraceae bacterium]
MKRIIAAGLISILGICFISLHKPDEKENKLYAYDLSEVVTTTEEIGEEPDFVYVTANIGPEAGVIHKVPLSDKEPEDESLTISTKYDFTLEEQYLLTALAMCEAGTEDREGKALVINVVLNRVADPRFPDTIHDVVYQSGQFTPATTGQLSTVAGDDECWAALDMVNIEGWDESNGALYFCASYVDFSGWANYLFSHGGHKFYR